MTISYNWLLSYLPSGIPADAITPQKISAILTSVGLEVEQMEMTQTVKGGLEGVVIGKVLECRPHPDADRLRVTMVNVGAGEPLQIVCGAPNVAEGQTVAVALAGSTIYPTSQPEGLTLRKAKIRGVESNGMICAEDELGLGESHDGIMILGGEVAAGTPAAEYFHIETDHRYEIGLTPNRMDAMSHLGVARDVCAWLSYHLKTPFSPVSPYEQIAQGPQGAPPVKVMVEDEQGCGRYAGISIHGVTIAESPDWLKRRLLSIGVRPINNVVDVTNFILHESGQPLHAFDEDAIAGKTVLVKTLPHDALFTTLDGRERKLRETDLMICDGDSAGMCIAGVFGGVNSGVTDRTTNIFLESAWFNPVRIRKTSFAHNLRTDAASRFEKGVDISQSGSVALRAADLIAEIAGGNLVGSLIDVYPARREKQRIALEYDFLTRLSGKQYAPADVSTILQALGFEVVAYSNTGLELLVPFHKPDISHPADLVEEVMRIDGLDNVEIPTTISISPGAEQNPQKERLTEKLANWLAGCGFNEVVTNSITNKAYFPEEVLQHSVVMLNSLSAELNMMRPSMLPGMLEVIAHNLNHKNTSLRLFDFGTTYHQPGQFQFTQQNQLCLAITGANSGGSWNEAQRQADFFQLKSVVNGVLAQAIDNPLLETAYEGKEGQGLWLKNENDQVCFVIEVSRTLLQQFGIKQPVFLACIYTHRLLELRRPIQFTELVRFPAVDRDLAFTVAAGMPYKEVDQAIRAVKLPQLQRYRLFDVYTGEKLEAGKKSFAVQFTFQHPDKTLNETEIEAFMQKIARALKQQLDAELRTT